MKEEMVGKILLYFSFVLRMKLPFTGLLCLFTIIFPSQAGLKSWEDFLVRVEDLQKTFEVQACAVEAVCDEVCEELSRAHPVSVTDAPARLQTCQVCLTIVMLAKEKNKKKKIGCLPTLQ